MNARLAQLGLVLTLALAIFLASPTTGSAFEGSLRNVALAPSIQAEADATPTVQQGSRYSRHIQRKKSRRRRPRLRPSPPRRRILKRQPNRRQRQNRRLQGRWHQTRWYQIRCKPMC